MGFLGGGADKRHLKAVRHIATYMYPVLYTNEKWEMLRNWAPGFSVDVQKYIQKKPNQNLLVTGATGQGKSKLMRLMLEMMPNPKTIFSYKEGDEYLQIEGNLIYAEKNLPNPFIDPEAFTSAFAVTFNISSEGIQASTAMSIVANVARESRSWDEFVKNAKAYASSARDLNVRAATNYLLEKIKRLSYKHEEIEIDLNKTNILDMSYLNDDAKTFYSELFLRQIYKRIRKRERSAPKVIVCVDEAHRLTRNIASKNESIINEMSREIRAFGMLWTATQNLSDIPDPLRNQFATQFTFSTTSEGDLRALSQISRDLAICTSGLRNHEFIDAKTEHVHQKVAIYRANISSLAERKLELSGRGSEPSAQERKASDIQYFRPPEDRPTPTIHAALLTIYWNKGAKLAELVKATKKQGFVTSDPTIYGAKGRPGIFETAVSLGLAREAGLGYELTEKGLSWIDSNRILEKGQNLGSDLHKQLMRKTIELLHKKNMLVIVPDEFEAPDMIAYPVDLKKKYLWDDKNRIAYEIQTTGRKDAVEKNTKKKDKYKIPITWVTYNGKILETIREITNEKDTYMLIKIGVDNDS